MDNSQRYIKMAIEAFGDVGYIKPSGNLPNLMIIRAEWCFGEEDKEFVINLTWEEKFENIFKNTTMPSPLGQLYRQDQLQEMVRVKTIWGNDALNKFVAIQEFVDNLIRFKLYLPPTMEQLWLAFVMKAYGKVWDSEKAQWLSAE